MLWAEHRQLKNLIIEMDAESVVRCVHGAAKPDATDELIIDCIEVLARLENTSVIFVKRDCNTVAHSLVSLALSAGCKLWEANVPDQIMAAVCKDLPFI